MRACLVPALGSLTLPVVPTSGAFPQHSAILVSNSSLTGYEVTKAPSLALADTRAACFEFLVQLRDELGGEADRVVKTHYTLYLRSGGRVQGMSHT